MFKPGNKKSLRIISYCYWSSSDVSFSMAYDLTEIGKIDIDEKKLRIKKTILINNVYGGKFYTCTKKINK